MTLRTLSLLSLVGLSIAGCKKYDENESFLHLRTPEARLAGTWTSTEVVANDTTASWTDFIAQEGMVFSATFDKAGTVAMDETNGRSFDGVWSFNDDKSVLHISELTADGDSTGTMLDLYWEIFSLEGTTMRAVQFREFNGETVSGQPFSLAFSKDD